MQRVGIYNRCSTEEEAQVNALSIQVSESREKAIQKGWEITKQYVESESGTIASNRSEYQRMLEDMEQDKFDIIMIKSIDRLMRSAKDWYLFLDKLTRNKKQLYIYIDSKFYTPDDSLITGIKAILAEDFSRELSKKIKNAHKRRQEKKSGLNITSPMYGWDKVDKNTFEINKEEAQNYRLAYAMAKEGKGFYTIAKEMYENGARSKRGSMISAVQWRKMLYSKRAYGTVIFHTSEYDFEAKRRRKLPESEWIYVENALPPIITKAYYEEVMEALAKRRLSGNETERENSRNQRGKCELSNKLYCEKCGAVYYRTSYKRKNGKCYVWKCSRALMQGRGACNSPVWQEEKLKEILRKECMDCEEAVWIRESNILEETLEVIEGVLGKEDKEIDRITKEIEKLQRKKKVLLEKYMEERIKDEDYTQVSEELTKKIKQLKGKQTILKEERENENKEERIRKIRETLNEELLNQAILKEAIKKIDKIVVQENGSIKLSFF